MLQGKNAAQGTEIRIFAPLPSLLVFFIIDGIL